MKRHSIFRIFVPAILLAALAVCFGCGGGGGRTPTASLPQFYPTDATIPASGPAGPGVEAFDKGVTAVLKKWNAPGASVAVAKDGKLFWARGYGYADFEAKQL